MRKGKTALEEEVTASEKIDEFRRFHVPTLVGAPIFRNSAITLNAVMRPVLGFSEGMFSMVMVNIAESDSTLMR